MPLNIRHLRLWLATAAAVLIAVVLGFLVVAQYRVRQLVRRIPQKAGIDIQQTASGFTFSKSEKGRTLFTIHASQMLQFKGGGKAELHDVNIVVYGKNSNRFDQIYGSGFEYDEQKKIISATGEVHIDLQADAEGVQHPDQAPPQELKNPVHVQTSGLVFDQNTGVAETHEQIQFRTPQASGTAMGALYNSRENTLTLERDIRIETHAELVPPKKSAKPAKAAARQRTTAAQSGAPAVITANHAVLHSNQRLGIMENVSATRASERLRANAVTIRLRDDSSIET